MTIEQLTHEEKKIVFACLCAYARGPFVHPYEVDLLSGLDREALDNLIEKWPSGDDSDTARAVRASMNLAALGIPPPGISDADWATWFSVDRDAVKRLYKKWRGLLEANETKT